MPRSNPDHSRAHNSPGPIPHTLSDFLCIDFVNSRFTEHTGTGRVFDRIDLEAWQLWYARRCGIAIGDPPSTAMRRRLTEVRQLLRQLLESGQPPNPGAMRELNRILAASSPLLMLSSMDHGVDLTPTWQHQDWRAVAAATVISYAELSRSGGIDRIKVCANPDCSYMFHDETRNRSRRFCDAALCGTLSRVRRHRAHTSDADPLTDTPTARSR
jgi:predicted RNA-binding Zn ribbon-like protein